MPRDGPKKPRAKLPVHLRRKKSKSEKGDKPEVYESDNYVRAVHDFERLGASEAADNESETMFTWALVFKMPADQHLAVPAVDEEELDEEAREHAQLEAETGIDLDGDGDVGELGTGPTGSTASAQLRIPHEAWMACKAITDADLHLQHAIPIDQRYLILAIGAPQDVLIDEAREMELLMRLQESKGALEFQRKCTTQNLLCSRNRVNRRASLQRI